MKKRIRLIIIIIFNGCHQNLTPEEEARQKAETEQTPAQLVQVQDRKHNQIQRQEKKLEKN